MLSKICLNDLIVFKFRPFSQKNEIHSARFNMLQRWGSNTNAVSRTLAVTRTKRDYERSKSNCVSRTHFLSKTFETAGRTKLNVERFFCHDIQNMKSNVAALRTLDVEHLNITGTRTLELEHWNSNTGTGTRTLELEVEHWNWNSNT